MKKGLLFYSNQTTGLARARARFLTQAIQLEEHDSATLTSAASVLTLVLILAGIAWSAVTHVNELAHARGKVIPEGLNHVVQHLEGGLVKTISVRGGDAVVKGDLLVRFDQRAIHAELKQLGVRKGALELEAERLAALVDGREPKFSRSGEQYPELASKQRTIYRAQKASHEGELHVARSQVARRESEIVQQRNAVESLQKEVALLSEQVRIRRKLATGQIVAKTELLSIQSQLAEVQSDLRRAQDGVAVSLAAHEEARQHAVKIKVNFYKELELQAGTIATELAEVFQTFARLEDRLQRAELRAAIDGVVQGLTVTSDQTVVKPGQVIMEIVPVDNTMLVEARVSPSDVGHVRIGQPVDVKIDSYDPSKFGFVEGKIERISANTYLDEQAQPYYRSEISLARAYLGSQAGELRIIPGMTVTADITTGSKTLLDYLLKPINRGLQTAFTER